MPAEQCRLWIEFEISTPDMLEQISAKRLGQIVTAELSFRQKLELLGSIYRDKRNDITVLAELDEVLKRVEQAEHERNNVVHSVWTTHVAKETAVRIKPSAKRRKGLKIKFESVSVKDLEDTADFIAKVAYDIQTLVIRFYSPNFRD